MTQSERRIFLIRELLREEPRYADIEIPKGAEEQKRLLRSLMNVRMPKGISEEFLRVQDEYLREEIAQSGITELSALIPIEPDIYLWQGDITTLRCGAIVNAANSQLRGCFVPCHKCIDNCIHTFAGIELRNKCDELMRAQGFEEPTGSAKITPAYNLPCDHILHTVGPIIFDRVRERDVKLLASCYTECLKLADEYGVESIAFCCISTGEFHFPNELAAETAVSAVKTYKAESSSKIKIIFNVFKDLDYEIYKGLLGRDQ